MNRITLILALLMLTGCEKTPETTMQTPNSEFQVEKLFTQDGCTVYRFHDVYARYFTKCVDAKSETTWREGCGKNCSRDVTVPSV